MSKYIWSWYDGEGNYCNKAESLEEIIEIVLAYYFDHDENVREYTVQVIRVGCTINISLVRDNKIELYDIEADEEIVLGFLEDIARKEDRPDMFGLHFL